MAAINPQHRILADNNYAYNLLQPAYSLPREIWELILAKLPSSSVSDLALSGRIWLNLTDEEHKKILLTYLRTIVGSLNPAVYANQVPRLTQIIENIQTTASATLRLIETKTQFGHELVDILCEVRRKDLNSVVLDPDYIPSEFANIIDIAKRTFKGNMALRTPGRVFTYHGPDPTLAGLRFVHNEVARHENSLKEIVTDEHVIYIPPEGQDDRPLFVHFPRLVDTRLLYGKTYGDVIHHCIPHPSYFFTTTDPKGALHFMLRLTRSANARQDQTIGQKIQEVLWHPETRTDVLYQEYKMFYTDETDNKKRRADEPTPVPIKRALIRN